LKHCLLRLITADIYLCTYHEINEATVAKAIDGALANQREDCPLLTAFDWPSRPVLTVNHFGYECPKHELNKDISFKL